MKTLLGIMGAGCMLAFMYLCIATSLTEQTVGKHVSALAMQAGDTLAKVDADLDEIHRATLEVGLTAMEARKASVKEVAMLNTWNRQVSATIANLNATFLSVQRTSDLSAQNLTMLATSTSATIQAVRPVLADTSDELKALRTATESLNALAANPDIPATLVSVRGIAADAKDTSADAKEWMHGILHPTWPERVWGIMLDIGSALNPFHL